MAIQNDQYATFDILRLISNWRWQQFLEWENHYVFKNYTTITTYRFWNIIKNRKWVESSHFFQERVGLRTKGDWFWLWMERSLGYLENAHYFSYLYALYFDQQKKIIYSK